MDSRSFDGKCHLNPDHQRVCTERGIPAEITREYGLYSWTPDAERLARMEHKRLGTDYEPSIPGLPLPEGESGLLIQYPDWGGEEPYGRVRLDDPGPDQPRYLAPGGRAVRPYIVLPAAAVWKDTSLPVYVVEAPLKAISMWLAGFHSIGLGGVLAGAHDRSALRDAREVVAHRELRERIDWRGRRVYTVFDAGQRVNPDVALGIAYVWEALTREGADVWVVSLPEYRPGGGHGDAVQDQGPDDFLARNGAPRDVERATEAMQGLIDAAVPADPVVRVRAVVSDLEKADAVRKVTELLRHDLVLQAVLNLGGRALWSAVAAECPRGVGVAAIRDAAQAFREAQKQKAQKQAEEVGHPYSVVDGCLYAGDVRLARFDARISDEVIKDDGVERYRVYRIRAKHPSGLPMGSVEVPAADFRELDWVAELGSSAIVEAGRGIREHTAVAIQSLSTPSLKHTYTTVGWREVGGQQVYLFPGCGGIGPDGPVDVDVELPTRRGNYHLPRQATADPKAALQHSLEMTLVGQPCHTRPILAATYLAPLCTLLHVDFSMVLIGRTGSLKSTLAAIGQSHFGCFNYNALPASWDSTANQLELALFRTKDTLLTIDNFVPASGGNDAAKRSAVALRVLQAIGDRSDRGRLGADLSERPPRPPQAMPVITAELLPVANESSLGRMMVLEVQPGEIWLDKVIEWRRQAHLSQEAMRGYIGWLATLPDLAERCRCLLAKHRTELADQFRGEAHERCTTSAAMLLVGLGMLGQYAVHIGAFDEHFMSEWWDAVSGSIRGLLARQPRAEQATAVDQYIAVLRALLLSGAITLVPGADQRLGPRDVGWVTSSEALLVPELAFRQVAEHCQRSGQWIPGMAEIHRQLREASDEVGPLLAGVGGTRHLTLQRSISGSRVRVLAFAKRVFEDALAARVSDDLEEPDYGPN